MANVAPIWKASTGYREGDDGGLMSWYMVTTPGEMCRRDSPSANFAGQQYI